MDLLINSENIDKGVPMPLVPIDGTAPYTLVVTEGSGTIDSNNVFVSTSYGKNVITLTDSDSNELTKTIWVSTPHQLVLDIIRTEMDYDEDQTHLWNQKWDIGKDDRVYVILKVLRPNVIGSKVIHEQNEAGDYEEIKTITKNDLLSIDILSHGMQAFYDQDHILMALKSDYAERQMNLNGFYIANQPQMSASLTELDGAAIPFRYNFNLALTYSNKQVKTALYYENFNQPSIIKDE